MFKFLEFFFGSSSGSLSDSSDSSASSKPSEKDEKKLEAEIINATASLDIENAIAIHENWKLRLELYIQGKSKEIFSPDVVCLDNKCDLGQWIYGKGRNHLGSYPGFTALTTHHKLFHHSASNIISLAQDGKLAEAKKTLSTQFEALSKMIVNDLNHILKVVERRSKNL